MVHSQVKGVPERPEDGQVSLENAPLQAGIVLQLLKNLREVGPSNKYSQLGFLHIFIPFFKNDDPTSFPGFQSLSSDA